jgi:HAD superfamily hydrolase (TIGR01509 family)
MDTALARRHVPDAAEVQYSAAAPPTLLAAPPLREALDALSRRWRAVFDSAEHALRSSALPGLSRLDPAELGERTRSLRLERDGVGRLLETFAREEHVRLRRPLSAPRATRRMLGLPTAAEACVFDLEGVLTASEVLHAAAWAETFDEFLWRRAEHAGERFAHLVRPFDPRADYFVQLHGRPRLDGVREFLAGRGISLANGRRDDPPGTESVHGLANRKNEVFRRLLEHEGVAAFEGSRRYLEAVHEAALPCVVVAASTSTREILARADLDDLVDALVDGDVMRRERLRPKPAPDTILAACRQAAVRPQHAVAFETTAAGLAAARTAGAGTVVAVRRPGYGTLFESRADVVVGDLAEMLDPALAP